MLTRRASSNTPAPTFSFTTTLSFAVNNAMGAGFLTLPYAFNRSGILLGIVCQAAIAVPLLLSIPMVLETMARGDLAFRLHLQSTEDSPDEQTALVKKDHPKVQGMPVFVGETQEGRLMVGTEKFEMSELCQMFMGMRWKHFFTLCISLYNYGCLWAFTSVFSNALTLVYPLVEPTNGAASSSYYCYTALFALIVVPLTIVGVHEQVALQKVLFLCRVLVVIIMVSTTFNAYLRDGGTLNGADPTPMVDISGISVMLPIAAYAFLFTPQIPVISEPVRDKRQLDRIFNATVYACIVGYTSIGIFVALLFGSDIFSSCNLHWSSYTAGPYLYSPSANIFGKLFIKSISYYCLAFPALDVVSAYPLMAIGLGNNLAAASSYSPDAPNISEEEGNRRCTIFRLLASVPPIIGACFMSNLGAITSYTGISGCFLGFIFPPLLSLQSEKYFVNRDWNANTIYSGPISRSSRYGMFVFGCLLICFVLGMNIATPMEAHDL